MPEEAFSLNPHVITTLGCSNFSPFVSFQFCICTFVSWLMIVESLRCYEYSMESE